LIEENLIIIIVTWKHGGADADVDAVHMRSKHARTKHVADDRYAGRGMNGKASV
jgi:hypothetical protein